jgi:hypothetical protein
MVPLFQNRTVALAAASTGELVGFIWAIARMVEPKFA